MDHSAVSHYHEKQKWTSRRANMSIISKIHAEVPAPQEEVMELLSNIELLELWDPTCIYSRLSSHSPVRSDVGALYDVHFKDRRGKRSICVIEILNRIHTRTLKLSIKSASGGQWNCISCCGLSQEPSGIQHIFDGIFIPKGVNDNIKM